MSHLQNNLANTTFSTGMRRPDYSNIDGRALLPDITNQKAKPRKNKGTRKRGPRRSHEKTAHSFDKWLNGVLDPKMKDRMVRQFGYSFSTSPKNSTAAWNGGHGTGSMRKVQSAPDSMQTRTHKLFSALSSACSFETHSYKSTDLKPRLQFGATLLTASSTSTNPIRTPPTVYLFKNVLTFVCNRKIKIYDVGGVPDKDKKTIALKLLNKGDIVQQSSSSSPIAIVKRSNGDHNFNQHALIHGSKELQSELAGIFGGAGISDPMNR